MRTLAASVSKASITVVLIRSRSRIDSDSMRESASRPLGIVTRVRSAVRKRVDRAPMRSTCPSMPSTFTVSPTRSGWSAASAIDPNRFSMVFCAPNAKAMPPMPRPASTVATG